MPDRRRRAGGVRTVLTAAAATALVAGCSLDSANVRRLHVLQRDPLLRCAVPGTSRWLVLDEAGTTNGVGFGGAAPTEVDRVWHLDGPARVAMARLVQCAQDAGWTLRRPATPSRRELVLTGRKTFERSWVASLLVGMGPLDFRGRPAVTVLIETDAV